LGAKANPSRTRRERARTNPAHQTATLKRTSSPEARFDVGIGDLVRSAEQRLDSIGRKVADKVLADCWLTTRSSLPLSSVESTKPASEKRYSGDEAQRAAFEASRISVTVVQRNDKKIKGFIVLPQALGRRTAGSTEQTPRQRLRGRPSSPRPLGSAFTSRLHVTASGRARLAEEIR
jgi:hypothetical protein